MSTMVKPNRPQFEKLSEEDKALWRQLSRALTNSAFRAVIEPHGEYILYMKTHLSRKLVATYNLEQFIAKVKIHASITEDKWQRCGGPTCRQRTSAKWRERQEQKAKTTP